MDELVKVRIAAPVKLGARWLKPGDQPEVTAEEKAELKAVGVLDLGADTALPMSAGETVTVEQFQQAVAAQAKALSDAVTSAAIEAACAEIIKERDTAVEGMEALHRRVEELQAEVAAERIAHDETRAALAAIQNARADNLAPDAPGKKPPETAEAGETPARTDTPPSEKAAKTAPKKGAAAATKG